VTAVCVAFVAGILPAGPTYCQSPGGSARLLPRMIAIAGRWPDGPNQWDTGPCLKTSYINACRAVGKGICDE